MDENDVFTFPDRPIAVYIFAAIGFLFAGVLSSEDAPPYFYICTAFAVLCFFQAYYQFFAVWLVILAIYSIGAAYYGWVLVVDVIRLSRGDSAQVLLDLDDSAVFIAFVALMIGVVCWLLRTRPRQRRVGSDV